MSKQKKPKPDPRNTVIRIPLPPQMRRPAAASTATKQKKFSDSPTVQKPLFDLDQGDAR